MKQIYFNLILVKETLGLGFLTGSAYAPFHFSFTVPLINKSFFHKQFKKKRLSTYLKIEMQQRKGTVKEK